MLISLSLGLLRAEGITGQSSATVTGSVTDSATGEALFGVAVQVEGTSRGTFSDVDGNYVLSGVTPGSVNLKFSLLSYLSRTESIALTAGQVMTLNIGMDAESMELVAVDEAPVVVGFRDRSNVASVISEVRNANSVSSGIGQAQIQRSNDSNAGEVARRIPGVTLIDNRFVIVRGLTERYNAVMLNNALVPSLETDVKSFSFDMIPSGVIDRFLVFKSPSADLPGEFAGGAIQVYTRNIPQYDNEVTVSMGSGYRSGTTFRDFRSSRGSSTDWLGYDNGYRQLPASFPSNVRDLEGAEALETAGRSLNDDWSSTETTAASDSRWSASLGRKWNIGNGVAGFVTSVNYSNTKLAFTNNRLDYNTFDAQSGQSDTIFNYQDNIYQQQSRVGILLNAGLRLGKTRIDVNNFLNQSGMQEDTYRLGINREEGNYRNELAFNYNQRTLYASQVSLTQGVAGGRGTLQLSSGFSLAHRSDPDWRRIRYTKPLDGSYDQWQAYIPFSAQPFYLGRLFLDMKENIPMASGSYSHNLWKTGYDRNTNEAAWASIKAGIYWEDKQRTFGVRNIGYAASTVQTYNNLGLIEAPVEELMDHNNLNDTDGLRLDEDTKGADSYSASNRLAAGYVMAMAPLGKWKISAGVRLEDNIQTLSSFTIQGNPLVVEIDTAVWLPSANISWDCGENSLIRIGYGKTINRPEFREIAPYYFYDFVFNSIYSGNDSLTFASVDNYDIRWEWYPSPSEYVSVGAFYKDFVNPIELFFAPGVGSGGTRAFIPGNTPGAISYGLELDIRKNLAGMMPAGFLNQLSVVANASLIHSEIRLAASAPEEAVDAKRPMMGQSPYIINAGLFWQDDTLGLAVSAMFNRIGERVVIVGVPGIPEVYEMPRSLIDFSISKTIGKYFTVRFAASDILNQESVLLQDANADGRLDLANDQRIQFNRRGALYTLGVTFKLRSDRG